VDFCVYLDILYKEVKALPRDTADVVLTVSDMVSVNSRASIIVSDVNEFPELPVIEGEKIDVPDLSPKLKKVFPAICQDQVRYALMCAYFDFKAGKLVATDGFRLHMEDIALADTEPLALPRAAAAILTKHPSPGTFTIAENGVSCDLAGGVMTIRPMSVNYPDYRNILNDYPCEEKLVFSAPQFLKVLEGVIPLTDNHYVSMEANGDLTIESESSVGKYRWHIPCTRSGNPPPLTFNLDFLVDAVSAYAPDTVELRCNQSYGATIINEKALVMPVRR
jgi:DNA polymerase III sliding clamp (beta) subunit (PCNA family)